MSYGRVNPAHYNELFEYYRKSSYDMGLDMISQDMIAGSLEPEQKSVVVLEALHCAEKEIGKLRQQYPYESAGEILRLNDIKTEIDAGDVSLGFMYVSMFEAGNKKVTVSQMAMKWMSDVADIYRSSELDLLDGDGIYSLAMAHELFHWIEEQNQDIYTESKNVQQVLFKRFKRMVNAHCVSEIAGRHFSRLFTGIDHNPQVYEHLLRIRFEEQQEMVKVNKTIKRYIGRKEA